jgi:AmmeMemoRadiSam system protein B
MKMPRSQNIRHSVIAGSWYPGTRNGLARTVDDYLARVHQPPVPGELLALISPHAGYAYSGQTAAHAYHQLETCGAGTQQRVDTVVLMGPSHRAWVGDYAVSAEDGYETPLGIVPLDQDFVAGLGKRVPLRQVRRDAEHSLEIQLPFLQRQLGDFSLVPIMMNADEPAQVRALAKALTETIRQHEGENGRTLLVASSDLHHIDNYDEVVRRDQQVVAAIADFDTEALTPLLMAPGCSVCGRMPILTTLHAAKGLGANSVQVLHHTNSGDVTGQRQPGQYTVGYLAAAIYKAW